MSGIKFFLLATVGIVTFVVFALIVLPTSPERDSLRREPEIDPLESLPAEGKEIAPVDLEAAMEASPDALAKGKVLYTQVCASCHGTEGLGDGPAAAALQEPPRNFQSPEDWKVGYKVTEIFTTLTEGLGSLMASYDYLPAGDRFALAHYVRSLGEFDHGTDDPADVEWLDQDYQLSAGAKEPNRVPLSLIFARMTETDSLHASLPPAKELSSRPGAQLYQRLIHDRDRAARFLGSLEGWHNNHATFVRAVSSGCPENGFRAAVATLNASQWNDLHALLSELSVRQEGGS